MLAMRILKNRLKGIGVSFTWVIVIICLLPALDHIVQLFEGRICPLVTLWGIQCPLCGGTRAFQAMLNGDFVSAIYWNTFVCFLMLFVLATIIVPKFRYATKKFLTSYPIHCVFGGLALYIIQWSINLLK
jgi:hypothetical protein